ncbi:MAG: cupin-like domain-containing protein [Myxococcales bacterium]|nr:cupin-like domain-containing protein [Myxococcales bacterium]
MHYDYYHLNAWVTEIYGRKEFTIFAAPREECFYPVPEETWMSGVENAFDPDYEKYPLFREVVTSKVVLEPGDTIFVPNGTWHSARSLDVTLSIAFDQLTEQNMSSFVSDVFTRRKARRPVVGAALAAYLTGLGAALSVKERLLDGK